MIDDVQRPRLAGLAASTLAALGLTMLALAGCTRAVIPLTFVTRTPSGPTRTPLPAPATTPIMIAGDPTGHRYAVVWVPADGELVVQQPAGVPGQRVGAVQPDQRGIALTGNSTLLGSSLWVEIVAPGAAGWVNSWYLTEDVAPEAFCDDPQVMTLLEALGSAALARDGGALASLASPRRGIVIRHDWWNPEVVIPAHDLPGIYESDRVFDWGAGDSPGMDVEGTFGEIIAPLLEDVFGGEAEVTCNSVKTGATSGEVRWPGEYANLNFYAFYRPANEPGSQLTWHTWAVGVEYVDGQPWAAVLVHYRAEILAPSGAP
jgi:hypothetical protein